MRISEEHPDDKFQVRIYLENQDPIYIWCFEIKCEGQVTGSHTFTALKKGADRPFIFLTAELFRGFEILHVKETK